MNILVIKLAAIGDVLMATPSLAALRAKYPGARIDVLIGEWAMPVLATNPHVDRLIVVDEMIFWRKKIFSLLALLLRLRRARYDKVYVMHWSSFFALFAFLTGAREREGFDRDGRAKFLTRKIPFREGVKGSHTVEKYLALVDDEYGSFDREMRIFLTRAERERARAWISARGLAGSMLIGVAPGGGVNPRVSMPSRCWPVEHFARLAEDLLRDKDVHIVLFGGKTEAALGEKIMRTVDSRRVTDMIGTTDLRQTAALMQACTVVVANDSAPLHLAAAAGTRTVSLFGPTAPYDKVPLGSLHTYLYRELSCSPCYRNGLFAACSSHRCMKEISVQEVSDEVRSQLLQAWRKKQRQT
jgi:lipopolysaccharide heptosyltransferase II